MFGAVVSQTSFILTLCLRLRVCLYMLSPVGFESAAAATSIQTDSALQTSGDYKRRVTISYMDGLTFPLPSTMKSAA